MKLAQPIWPRFLPTQTVLACATLGPVGRRLPAPGTWGSAAGLLYFTVFFDRSPLEGIVGNLILSAIGAYVAVALCGEAEFRMGRKDPGEVVLDEFVAMPLCFAGWPRMLGPLPAWAIFLAGFAIFRFYDVTKPLGIKKLQNLPAGWGIVLDDTAAAVATCATLHLLHAIWAMLSGSQ